MNRIDNTAIHSIDNHTGDTNVQTNNTFTANHAQPMILGQNATPSFSEKLESLISSSPSHTPEKTEQAKVTTHSDALKFYHETKDNIEKEYIQSYSTEKSSSALSKDIKPLSNRDAATLLSAVRDNPELKDISLKLSRRSALFDKLIIMKSDSKNPWVLRLHTYPTMDQKNGPVDNLGRKIVDSENNTHFHRWNLSSKFISGGFVNGKYKIQDTGPDEHKQNEYEIVATKDSNGAARAAINKGIKFVSRTANELYQKGDIVHYPIDTPHSVDSSGSAYLGTTMTLAHTSESIKDKSTFYQKNLSDAVPQIKYTDEEHTQAINDAITRLQLVDLADQLANSGKEFERFSKPNAMETELLPTIAMVALEDKFQEKNAPPAVSDRTAAMIKNAVRDMDKKSLESLIIQSQGDLSNVGFFTTSIESLNSHDVKDAINNRSSVKPSDVLN